MTARDHDLVLFGASGYVGALTAGYLAEHTPPGARIALAGRSKEKLDTARRALPAAATAAA
ncbi:MAG: enoyl-ACP reductase, partial [Actinomycetota bacterium]|nr:enoyl-ACP reductase [Actinomycetota bacterium]